MQTIILTGEPKSTQHCYGLSCRGKFATRYMTEKGKDLKEDYGWQAKSQWKQEVISEPIDVTAKFYFGNKRKQDIDNFNKILLDSLTGIVWADDSQIQRMTLEKAYDKENPRIELSIAHYTEEINRLK